MKFTTGTTAEDMGAAPHLLASLLGAPFTLLAPPALVVLEIQRFLAAQYVSTQRRTSLQEQLYACNQARGGRVEPAEIDMLLAMLQGLRSVMQEHGASELAELREVLYTKKATIRKAIFSSSI